MLATASRAARVFLVVSTAFERLFPIALQPGFWFLAMQPMLTATMAARLEPAAATMSASVAGNSKPFSQALLAFAFVRPCCCYCYSYCITFLDSTSSRLLSGSNYSCCIRNFHAVVVHKNSATPYSSRQHIRSCNDVNGSCTNRPPRLTTAAPRHETSRWASSSTGK
jgi:hypothetical protein